MRFKPRQQIPDIAIDLRHLLGRLQHLLQAAFVQRLYLSEPQARPCLHQSHRLGVGDGTRRIKDKHAVIQFVANLGGLRKTFNQNRQALGESFVGNPDLGQSLDQIESRPGRVQCGEHDGGGRLVGPQQDHQDVNEEAFVVRPAADQVPDQGENERAAICRGRSGRDHRIEVRFWGKLADIH